MWPTKYATSDIARAYPPALLSLDERGGSHGAAGARVIFLDPCNPPLV